MFGAASSVVIYLLTYVAASDALYLPLRRLLRPRTRDECWELFVLTRGLGPVAIAWLLFHLLMLAPHRAPAFYVGSVAVFFVLMAAVGRAHAGELFGTYRDLWRRLPRCWPPGRLGQLLLILAAALAAFMLFIGIGYPIVECDALGFATEARLIYRDSGFDHYPTFAADPQTGYYYLTFQLPCLQSLYVWFFLLMGGTHSDVLLRTVAPTYSLFCALLVFWALWQRTRRIEVGWWGVVALWCIPVFIVHSYLNSQDPHRIWCAFAALIWLSAALRAPSVARALVLGVYLGLAAFAHFFGLLTAVVAGVAYAWLARASLIRRLATLAVVVAVAMPVSSVVYYARTGPPQSEAPDGDRLVRQRLLRQLVSTGAKQPQPQAPLSDWLLQRRGQSGAWRRVVFGVFIPFTGIEWFGALFWLLVVSVVRWMRRRDKTPLECIMVLTAVGYCGVIMSGVRALSWSNPRYAGTLAPVLAYFAALFAMAPGPADGHRRRGALPPALLLAVLLLPLAVVTLVRGAKVGITNPGDFYARLHSTEWIRLALADPVHAADTVRQRYLGFLRTVRHAASSDQEKVLHSHDYFRAVDYMNCCTPADSRALVIGRETYYFYYAQRRGASLHDPQLRPFFGARDAREACGVLAAHTVTHVLLDAYHHVNPLYAGTFLATILDDAALAEPVHEFGTARVYHLRCAMPAAQASP